MIIGFDYTTAEGEGSEAGLITAVVIFSIFVAVSYYFWLFRCGIGEFFAQS